MSTDLNAITGKVREGAPLTDAEVRELAHDADLLAIGMLADETRRRARGRTTTYLRVAVYTPETLGSETVPPAARELRVTGPMTDIDAACAVTRTAKSLADGRPVAAWSLVDLAALGDGVVLPAHVRALKDAGLDRIADIPIDRLPFPEDALEAVVDAGFSMIRLTIDRASADDRVRLVLLARELQRRFPAVTVVNPLPMTVNPFRPTTGYEDVRMVALTRLAVADDTRVQVDWQRYGPKLAQVALTFGADDLDTVSPVDESPEGARRSPVAEVRRNIEAAGLTPVERDASFNPIA